MASGVAYGWRAVRRWNRKASRSRCAGSGWTWRTSLVEDEAAAKAELQGGDGKDQHGEYQAYGGGFAELQLLEGGFEDDHDGGPGGVAGAAVGQDIGLVEDL